METDFYVAIRKDTDSEKEWMDSGAFGISIESVQRKVKEVDEAIPHWAKDNPVVRIVEVKAIEGAGSHPVQDGEIVGAE